jgi:hypothetical protein
MNIDGVDGFEHFSLRVTRGLLIGSIATGCVSIACGLFLAAGIWLLPGPDRAVIPPAPAPKALTPAMAESWASQHAPDQAQLEQAAGQLATPGAFPGTLAALFPSPPYPVADEWEEYCKVPSDYGCMQRAKRLKVMVPARLFSALMGDAARPVVDEMATVLQQQLPGVAVERRSVMIEPILMAHIELKKANQKIADDHDAEVRRINSNFDIETVAHRAKQTALSGSGLLAAAWGLGTVVAASMFVALLAIERHLRQLRRAGMLGRPSAD